MRKLWNALRRPSARWSVLALVAIGIVIGIALIVLPHVGIKVTSTTEFCVSCHSMQPVYEEYKQSVHYAWRPVSWSASLQWAGNVSHQTGTSPMPRLQSPLLQ